MTSKEYWNQLNFAYLVSYSFNRGEELEKYQSAIDTQLTALQNALKIARYMQQIPLQKQIDELKEAKNIYRTKLINKEGKFHTTAQAITTLSVTDPQTQRLGSMLTSPIETEIAWACPPIYRDAFVFYDKTDKIVSILNICLECDSLEITEEIRVITDYSVFKKLKEFLTQIGHPIEKQN